MKRNQFNKNIRVLHLVKSLDIGGVEKSTILYSNELANKINFVGILASKGFFDSSNIISDKVYRFFPPQNIENIFWFFFNLMFLIKKLRINKISHLHYHQRVFIPFIFFIKLLNPNIKIIYSHQNVFKDKINYLIIADFIVALTKAVKNDLPKFLQKKTTIIPHGTILPNMVNIKNKPLVFGFVGRFVKWKNILELINEFVIVNKNYPLTKLFIIGDGPQKHEIINKIKNIELEKNIILIAPQNNLTTYYDLIDVLILPSKILEGFGIVIIEAMSYGIPVIVFENPVFEEIIKNNENGIVVKERLSKGMLELLSSDSLFRELSNNAKKSSIKYDLSTIVNRYINEIY